MDIIIGVTSGIACYKIIELIKALKKLNHNVNAIMTKNSLNLIEPKEFEKASGNKVAVGLFRKGWGYEDYLKHNKDIKHISLAEKADIVVVAPATANIIGKVANGIADDLLSTTIMATKAPVLFCPAMNCNMWNNPIVKENARKLKKLGYIVLEPETGRLACGYGEGRLPSNDKIKSEIFNVLENKNRLKNKKIIV